MFDVFERHGHKYVIQFALDFNEFRSKISCKLIFYLVVSYARYGLQCKYEKSKARDTITGQSKQG